MTAHQTLVVVVVVISIICWYIGFASAAHIDKKVKEIEDYLGKVIARYKK